MPSYPVLTGKQVIRVLESFGFELERITGSHHMMGKPGYPTIPVPVHGKKHVREGTLRGILRIAGLTRKQFYKAYWNL